MSEHTTHLGEKIKRFRQMLGVKQDALAMELGDDWNQKKVSMLEAKADIDPALMEKVANALKVPKEAIENFETEKVVNFITNTFNDNATQNGNYVNNDYNNNPTINPIEKIIEIQKEKEVLFERMLKDKDDMIARLEKLMGK